MIPQIPTLAEYKLHLMELKILNETDWSGDDYNIIAKKLLIHRIEKFQAHYYDFLTNHPIQELP